MRKLQVPLGLGEALMKLSCLNRSMGLVALLTPYLAGAESHLGTEPAPSSRLAGRASATAHLAFKIVIPPLLALEIPGLQRTDSPVGILISSNGRAARGRCGSACCSCRQR